MPIVTDREEIRNPLDFQDLFRDLTGPEDLVEQLKGVHIGFDGWTEILPEMIEVEDAFSRGEQALQIAGRSGKHSLAAAVLGHVLPEALTVNAFDALNKLYFSLPKATVDFDAIGNPGFTDPDLD